MERLLCMFENGIQGNSLCDLKEEMKVLVG